MTDGGRPVFGVDKKHCIKLNKNAYQKKDIYMSFSIPLLFK